MTAGPLNRFWLTVIGLILALAGLTGLGLGTGVLQQTMRGAGLAGPGDRVFGGAAVDGVLDSAGWASLVAVVGAVIALLGLAWLIAQIPRPPRTPELRLHDDARNGTIIVGTKVLAEALETRVAGLPGVADASVRLRGTADHPDVAVQVKVEERSDVAEVVRAVRDRIVDDLAIALETTVDRLGIQVADVSPAPSGGREIVL